MKLLQKICHIFFLRSKTSWDRLPSLYFCKAGKDDDFIMRTLNLAPDQIPFSQQRQDLHEMNRLISIMLNSIWQRINTDSRVAERDLER